MPIMEQNISERSLEQYTMLREMDVNIIELLKMEINLALVKKISFHDRRKHQFQRENILNKYQKS